MLFATLVVAGTVLSAAVLASVALTILEYPYDTDNPLGGSNGAHEEYYRVAYGEADATAPDGRFAEQEEYVLKARSHAHAAGVPQMVRSFMETCQSERPLALEVGAGSGLLQDVVSDYVGTDLSLTARRFFHKPFVQSSATDLPFRDNAFDAVWSVWVLEHVSNPERALNEIRRVVKNNGYILLRPAWNVDSWAADGYEVRPYADFGFKGWLIKASIPIRLSRWYSLFHARQVRIISALRAALSRNGTRLHFVRLKPNYSRYWVTDSDAAISLDFFEVFLWFATRGDDCVNCPSTRTLLFGRPGQRPEALIVRVNKN
jgi:SAM-dependent methyltransferase